MYIKPALPCLPFLVVSSINLLSRPGRGGEGNTTAKGVPVTLLHSQNEENFLNSHAVSRDQRKLKFRACKMREQNVSGRGGLAVGRGTKPDWPESSFASPPGRPLWPPLRTPALTRPPGVLHSSALKPLPPFAQPCLASPSRTERDLSNWEGGS